MIAFWLLPAPPEDDLLASLIAKLAARHKAPVFTPHATLLAGEFDNHRALEALHAIRSVPLEMAVDSIRFSGAFTKTLFVQFRPAPAAAELSSTIRKHLDGNCKYTFDPHLSLIYKTMSHPDKQEIAKGIILPFQRVSFDRVRVIRGPSDTRTAADVNAWSTVGERPLRPALLS